MGYQIVKIVGAWWPAAWIVIIGGWKTTEFATTIAGDPHDWLLRAMAGLLFFGPFIAAEMLPLQSGLVLPKVTKALLFSYLMIALLLQALNSTRTMVSDGMERERLLALQKSIDQYEEQRLGMLDHVYNGLLRENGCLPKANRARKNAIACETLWRQFEEVLNAPKTYMVDPPGNDALRELLRHRLDALDDLCRKVPAERRVFEYGTSFDFTSADHSTVEILAWTAHHSQEERAQALIAQFCRSLMLLILTIIVGIWYHASADKRKKYLSKGTEGQ